MDLRIQIKELDLFLAHIQVDKQKNIIKEETLEQHTQLCQKYFGKISRTLELPEVLKRIWNIQVGSNGSCDGFDLYYEMFADSISFHDTGKVNPLFQKNKMHHNLKISPGKFQNLGSIHSIFSSILYINEFKNKIASLDKKEEKELLRDFLAINAYVIAKHHSDLSNFEDFRASFKEGGIGYTAFDILEGEWEKFFACEFTLKYKGLYTLLYRAADRMKEAPREETILFYAYTRMLYSVLTASDYYATTEFMAGFEIRGFGDLHGLRDMMEVYETTSVMQKIRTYEKEMYPCKEEEFRVKKQINELRSELFLETERELINKREQNIFYLEAPTGSGKSNTSMNLGFQLVKGDERLRKIFYVYPFNTLVEQNRINLEKIFENHEKCLGEIAVLNSTTPIKLKGNYEAEYGEAMDTHLYQRSLLDRQFLNDPMILTTHVSLFDTMFGNTKESVFGFHQLVNSVIILDEIQSYRNVIWGEIIHFLHVFAKALNMKVIIMSATLPDLDLFVPMKAESVRLVKDSQKYFLHPCFRDRVRLNYELLGEGKSLEALYGHVRDNSGGKKKILIEFIKKKTAYEFYTRLKEDKNIVCRVEYMSGDDSILERSRILNIIKDNRNVPIILVATQVVEAGVDIDMDIGYKNISKLDSEEQFMGRINRSCLGTGIVYFFEADDCKAVYKDDVRRYERFTVKEELIRKYLEEKRFLDYYKLIIQIIRENYNDVCSERGLEHFFQEEVGGLAFFNVMERMRLIEDNQWSVSVYLARVLTDEGGNELDGRIVWDSYVSLLQNQEMDYSERRIKLSQITSKMNHFIYQIKKNSDFMYNDRIGELFYINEGDKYFDNGKLNREKLEGGLGEFTDFI